jgi:hypothetical protein
MSQTERYLGPSLKIRDTKPTDLEYFTSENFQEAILHKTINTFYLKKNSKGIIQIAGFGKPWEKLGMFDTCWAAYGHIIKK